MKIKIKVTKEILEASKDCIFRFSPKTQDDLDKDVTRQCAVSKAIITLLPDAFVFQTSIRFFRTFEDFQDSREYLLIPLPEVATHWIKRFDELEPNDRVGMPPINFEVDLPDELIDRIGLSEIHRILKESKTLELV